MAQNTHDNNIAKPFVDFTDVWLAYNDELLAKKQYAVEAIDLKVKQGEFIAIVGPSGCGKSTFMKLATGLKMPSIVVKQLDGTVEVVREFGYDDYMSSLS